jgi:outer membrane immunogenic protein
MMRRISLGLLAATAMGVIASQGALAADLRPALKAPPPAPPPVQDWSGIYVGLEGGYGWGKENFNPAFDPFFFSTFFPDDIVDASIGSVSQSGWLFGGFVGAQKQWGSWVLGIEADFDAADIKGTTNRASSTCVGNVTICSGGNTSPVIHFADTENQNHSIESKIDELGSVRGKVGWAWSPNWMIYGTGGLALAHTEDNHSFSQVDQVCEFSLSNCSTFFSAISNLTAGTSRFGWAAGAGLDWKWQIDPGSAVVFGVEYLHYQFEGDNRSLGDAGGFALQSNTSLSVDTVKGRISYLFSIH